MLWRRQNREKLKSWNSLKKILVIIILSVSYQILKKFFSFILWNISLCPIRVINYYHCWKKENSTFFEKLFVKLCFENFCIEHFVLEMFLVIKILKCRPAQNKALSSNWKLCFVFSRNCASSPRISLLTKMTFWQLMNSIVMVSVSQPGYRGILSYRELVPGVQPINF